jgi:internalin A
MVLLQTMQLMRIWRPRSLSLDGLAIARERIAKEAEEKTGFLDLGNLGLRELPEELFRLGHLRRLNLGSSYRDVRGNSQNSISHGEDNSVGYDLHRLTALSELRSLFLSGTVLSDLAGLAGLANIVEIACSFMLVSDLAPVAGLSNLQTLNCSFTLVSDLAPVAGLSNLQTLDCSYTQVSDLAPVAGLSNLQTLDCSHTPVSDLAPVAGLSHLQTLDCSGTQVSDLAPIAGLSNLRTLSCSRTQVSDLAPVAGLSNLQTLSCSNTHVSDLAPVAGLSNLQTLDCSGCRLIATPPSFWHSIRKMRLFLCQAIIPHVPAEVLSQGLLDNCFDSLRAHFKDIAAGSEDVSDVKLMVLGNGRIGKTQICRRLRHEQFDETVASTHGILVTSAPLKPSEGVARRCACKSGISAGRISITAPTRCFCVAGRFSCWSGFPRRRIPTSAATMALPSAISPCPIGSSMSGNLAEPEARS